MVPSHPALAWWTNLGGLLRGTRTPVALCYHGVATEPPADDPHGLVLHEAELAAQLDLLLELGYRLVSARELWRTIDERGPRGATGLAAVTFDDGMAETLLIAARLLKDRDGQGSAFVLPGLLGQPHPDLPETRLADAAELRALAGGPLELGSHTRTHVNLEALDDERATRELFASRIELEALLDRPVHGLAYPFGRYGAATVRAAERAGYEYGCACAGTGPWRRYELPRETIFPSTTPTRLRAKAAGLYGPVAALAEWRNERHPHA